MKNEQFVLTGRIVRLEPLGHQHLGGLVAAATADPSIYTWSPIPQAKLETTRYIQTAIDWFEAGTATAFATIRIADGAVIGSTRFFNIERWDWPAGHLRHGRAHPDACEIGHTWLTAPALRTGANTEAKLLMLTHAFEQWQMLRVCLHADERNLRSRAAIERIGGKFEGILRAHRMAADFIARNSARYSIVAEEWPELKVKLIEKLR